MTPRVVAESAIKTWRAADGLHMRIACAMPGCTDGVEVIVQDKKPKPDDLREVRDRLLVCYREHTEQAHRAARA